MEGAGGWRMGRAPPTRGETRRRNALPMGEGRWVVSSILLKYHAKPQMLSSTVVGGGQCAVGQNRNSPKRFPGLSCVVQTLHFQAAHKHIHAMDNKHALGKEHLQHTHLGTCCITLNVHMTLGLSLSSFTNFNFLSHQLKVTEKFSKISAFLIHFRPWLTPTIPRTRHPRLQTACNVQRKL